MFWAAYKFKTTNMQIAVRFFFCVVNYNGHKEIVLTDHWCLRRKYALILLARLLRVFPKKERKKTAFALVFCTLLYHLLRKKKLYVKRAKFRLVNELVYSARVFSSWLPLGSILAIFKSQPKKLIRGKVIWIRGIRTTKISWITKYFFNQFFKTFFNSSFT